MINYKLIEDINYEIQRIAYQSLWTNDVDVIRKANERIVELQERKKRELIK